jgi:hypothetical protein
VLVITNLKGVGRALTGRWIKQAQADQAHVKPDDEKRVLSAIWNSGSG